MGVHAASGLALDRLGHERGEESVAVGDVADHEPEGGEVVRGRERVGVAEVDLVLARRHLVMGRLHLEAHQLEIVHDQPAQLLALVHRGQVEVAARSWVLVVGSPSASRSNRKNSTSHPAIML